MTRPRNVLPPQAYRIAELVITRIWRGGFIRDDKMREFHQVTAEILTALLPADLRRINSGRWKEPR